MANTRTIKVNYLARVEGEGALYLKVKDDAVVDVELRIFEPPRFFEAFLRGRKFDEAPDLTARICGICPIAYQMSAAHAMEQICGVRVDGPIRDLRRLIYCGEWIESHALHLFMLHAPDFLGYPDAIRMAEDHSEIVTKGIELKKVGNALMTLLGGREIHPVNPCVGGFYSVPTRRTLLDFADQLKWARDAALETVQWTSTLPFPDFEQAYEFVALRHPEEYPFNEGRIVSNRGLDISLEEADRVLVEEQVDHSTSLHAHMRNGHDGADGEGVYFVGPMARYAVNFDKLSPLAQDAARAAGLGTVCVNPFQSIIVRAVEILYACDEALRIIDAYEMPDRPRVPVEPRAGTGYGCTEAPRGICYHRYTIDDAGIIQDARIMAPTSQNQPVIERDLRNFVAANLHLPKQELQWRCEQAIRNYDPCISCSCH